MTNVNEVGITLGLIAKKKRLSQGKIAEEVKISRISVNRFFCGHTQLRASDFVNVCLVLGIDINNRLKEELVNTKQVF